MGIGRVALVEERDQGYVVGQDDAGGRSATADGERGVDALVAEKSCRLDGGVAAFAGPLNRHQEQSAAVWIELLARLRW